MTDIFKDRDWAITKHYAFMRSRKIKPSHIITAHLEWCAAQTKIPMDLSNCRIRSNAGTLDYSSGSVAGTDRASLTGRRTTNPSPIGKGPVVKFDSLKGRTMNALIWSFLCDTKRQHEAADMSVIAYQRFCREFKTEGEFEDWLRTKTDPELLRIPNIGRKGLKLLRKLMPRPPGSPNWIDEDDIISAMAAA